MCKQNKDLYIFLVKLQLLFEEYDAEIIFENKYIDWHGTVAINNNVEAIYVEEYEEHNYLNPTIIEELIKKVVNNDEK